MRDYFLKIWPVLIFSICSNIFLYLLFVYDGLYAGGMLLLLAISWPFYYSLKSIVSQLDGGTMLKKLDPLIVTISLLSVALLHLKLRSFTSWLSLPMAIANGIVIYCLAEFFKKISNKNDRI